ncbi:sn-glycerol-3-phosphate ABC transporter permease UgpA [Tepidicella xavieri]|jgi:sn-glycerol 3-phosphate transport system permease protein|uniref:sn-glycerol-3-phosphate transport system permease protein UgpA n=1 Tax=Tepidicella xavieri TaxID=360241 RepID=A0A4R6U3P7_9BURK|nr:sn-glycerol-3-phosphate ABC transporter permease UgpA [Tepidicella xavieri]TDQ40651.1 carbohydrate ABC transporter membrane protein 1 (CUT1 family) [Tepidicella xavieri]
MQRKVIFPNRWLPYMLLAPQLAVTLVFFIWPSAQAVMMAFQQQDPFGLAVQWVGLENFHAVLTDPAYYDSVVRTLVFSTAVTVLALAPALALAVAADALIRGRGAYTTGLMVPYAIAPAIAGVLWLFMFNPAIGVVSYGLRSAGVAWNPTLDGTDAMILVILASAWKQIAYNFLFFLAGLQSIPKSLLEAAAIDGASPWHRFRTIIFPLLSPTTFFLLVVGLVYAFFDTFGVIHAVTAGGPAKATEILVYKVYYDGIVALDLGSSAAQSVLLMLLVIGLTLVQFRFVERRVHYS